MSKIEEFTGCAGIAPVTVVGAPQMMRLRRKRRKQRATESASVDIFCSGRLREDDFDGDNDIEDELDGSPAGEMQAAAPVAAPAAKEEPETPVAEAKARAPGVQLENVIYLTQGMLEALANGQTVSARGVVIQPAAPLASAATPAAKALTEEKQRQAEAAVRAVTESVLGGVTVSQSMSEASSTAVEAKQPDPTPTTNGRAVMAAYRALTS